MFGGGGKLQISVNTTTIANGDSIASYLVDAAGNLLNSTLIGAKQSLNTTDAGDKATDTAFAAGDIGMLSMGLRHDANTSIASATGNYAPLQLDALGNLKISGTLTANFTAEHNQGVLSVAGDSLIAVANVRQDTLTVDTSVTGDYNWFKSTALGEIYTHDSSALAELVLIKGDTASIVTNTGNIATSTATTATNTGTIATNTGNTTTALTNLTHAQNAAFASGDKGVEFLAVRQDTNVAGATATGDYSYVQTWSEGSLKVVDVANGAILQQQVSVTSTATKFPTTPLANRRSIMLQNVSLGAIFLGSSTVTATGATTGILVPANSFVDIDVGPAVDVYAVKVGAGSLSMNILEVA